MNFCGGRDNSSEVNLVPSTRSKLHSSTYHGCLAGVAFYARKPLPEHRSGPVKAIVSSIHRKLIGFENLLLKSLLLRGKAR